MVLVVVLLGAVAVMGLIRWRAAPQEPSAAQQPSAAPQGSASPAAAPVDREGPTRVLPPICGNPNSVDLPPPYDDPRECPDTLPTGRVVGMLTGLHLVRDVALDIPGPGWTARSLGLFDGIELVSPEGNGLTLITYPVLGRGRESLSGTDLRDALAAGATRISRQVRLLDGGSTELAGWPATRMDVTPRGGAATSDDCRLDDPCLPLLSLMLGSGTVVVELRPDVVSRLVVEDFNDTRVQVAAWIHDVSGPDADAIAQVLDGLEISDAYEPAPPSSASPTVTG